MRKSENHLNLLGGPAQALLGGSKWKAYKLKKK